MLHLSGPCPKNAGVSDFFGDISIAKFCAMFCNVNRLTAVCKLSCEGAQTNVQNVHLLVQALFCDCIKVAVAAPCDAVHIVLIRAFFTVRIS
jgi:hypothetical protein